MPEEKAPEQAKSLEMRVAELEDKLSKQHITEEEWKTYQKVASSLGGQAVTQPALSCLSCINCVVVVSRTIYQPCVRFAATGLPGGGGGSGFGTLGM